MAVYRKQYIVKRAVYRKQGTAVGNVQEAPCRITSFLICSTVEQDSIVCCYLHQRNTFLKHRVHQSTFCYVYIVQQYLSLQYIQQ